MTDELRAEVVRVGIDVANEARDNSYAGQVGEEVRKHIIHDDVMSIATYTIFWESSFHFDYRVTHGNELIGSGTHTIL